MKLKQFYILIISLFACAQLPAQTVDELVRLADEQYQRGEYAIAAREYNRAFFFGSKQPDVLSLQIAHCYANLNQTALAIEFYNKAYLLSVSDSLKNEAVLGNTFCYMLQEDYVLSISELYNLNEPTTLAQKIQFHFLKGIAHYGIGDDTLAFDELQQSLFYAGTNDSVEVLLTREFDKVFRYQQRFNPRRAYIMSGIVPGSGQLSVGAIQEGLNSMLLIGGLYLIAIHVVRQYSFIDAAIALFPWVQRYYLGGMEKSKSLALSKIENKRYESYLKILELSIPDSYR